MEHATSTREERKRRRDNIVSGPAKTKQKRTSFFVQHPDIASQVERWVINSLDDERDEKEDADDANAPSGEPSTLPEIVLAVEEAYRKKAQGDKQENLGDKKLYNTVKAFRQRIIAKHRSKSKKEENEGDDVESGEESEVEERIKEKTISTKTASYTIPRDGIFWSKREEYDNDYRHKALLEKINILERGFDQGKSYRLMTKDLIDHDISLIKGDMDKQTMRTSISDDEYRKAWDKIKNDQIKQKELIELNDLLSLVQGRYNSVYERVRKFIRKHRIPDDDDEDEAD